MKNGTFRGGIHSIARLVIKVSTRNERSLSKMRIYKSAGRWPEGWSLLGTAGGPASLESSPAPEETERRIC